jgi:hypothetical protein
MKTMKTTKTKIEKAAKKYDYVVIGRFDHDDRGMGDMSYRKAILYTADELNEVIKKSGHSWIVKVYKVGEEFNISFKVEKAN